MDFKPPSAPSPEPTVRFHVLPRLGTKPRLAVALPLIALGGVLQIAFGPFPPGVMLVITAGLMLAGNLLLLLRGHDVGPPAKPPAGEWEETTRERFRGALEQEKRMRRWDETWIDITCKLGCFTFFIAAALIAFAAFAVAANPLTRPWAFTLLADAVVLLVPHWVTGLRVGLTPLQPMHKRLEALEAALAEVESGCQIPHRVQPMFEMVGEGERRMPVDARIFVRFPEAPESFLGLQFQVAMNNVQGTLYPYLYAVIVARKEFGLLDRGGSRIPRVPNIDVESQRETDVDVLVIRQHTTKRSGYHTKPAAIQTLALTALSGVEAILAQADRGRRQT